MLSSVDTLLPYLTRLMPSRATRGRFLRCFVSQMPVQTDPIRGHHLAQMWVSQSDSGWLWAKLAISS